MLLSKEQILAMNDLPFEDVDVPEWGGTVRVRVMMAVERDAWESSIFTQKDDGGDYVQTNMRATLVARCLADDSGALTFTDQEIIELGKKSSRALDRVFKVASRINAISQPEQEQLEKN